MLLSEKITAAVAIWILVSLILTSDVDLEFFFITVFIGVLVIRELTDVFSPSSLKDRMNVFIYTFVFIFMVIVGKKIITILGF